MKIYALMITSAADGDGDVLRAIFSTREKAEAARSIYVSKPLAYPEVWEFELDDLNANSEQFT